MFFKPLTQLNIENFIIAINSFIVLLLTHYFGVIQRIATNISAINFKIWIFISLLTYVCFHKRDIISDDNNISINKIIEIILI